MDAVYPRNLESFARCFTDLQVLVALDRTGEAGEIEFSVEMSALGLVSRLEHALDHFDAELAQHRRSLTVNRGRVADYTPRLGMPFALQAELDGKYADLTALEASLAATSKEAAAPSLADDEAGMPRLRARAANDDVDEQEGEEEAA